MFVYDFPHLSFLKIVDERIRDIAPLKHAQQLRVLSLEKTDVVTLAPLVGMSLRRLELIDNRYMDDYSAIYEMPNLETLILDELALTKLDVDELMRINPNLKLFKPGDSEPEAHFPWMQI